MFLCLIQFDTELDTFTIFQYATQLNPSKGISLNCEKLQMTFLTISEIP